MEFLKTTTRSFDEIKVFLRGENSERKTNSHRYNLHRTRKGKGYLFMDKGYYEGEKEKLLSMYSADQILYYQKLVDETQSINIEEKVQCITVEETGTNG